MRSSLILLLVSTLVLLVGRWYQPGSDYLQYGEKGDTKDNIVENKGRDEDPADTTKS